MSITLLMKSTSRSYEPGLLLSQNLKDNESNAKAQSRPSHLVENISRVQNTRRKPARNKATPSSSSGTRMTKKTQGYVRPAPRTSFLIHKLPSHGRGHIAGTCTSRITVAELLPSSQNNNNIFHSPPQIICRFLLGSQCHIFLVFSLWYSPRDCNRF